MRPFVVALMVLATVLSGCGDDDDGGGVDTGSEDAQAYLADLEEAGLGDLFEDDEAAVAYVATACENAEAVGQTPEALIESGAVSEQAAVALVYCDTSLGG